jgi:hypothetical protein
LPLNGEKSDPFSLKNTMQNINNWDVVENGVLLPVETEKKERDNNTTSTHFKIPLMLRSIGACIYFGLKVF